MTRRTFLYWAAMIVAASTTCERKRDSPRSTVADRAALPGSTAYKEALAKQFDEAVAARGPTYKPRTKHLNKDGTAQFTNRLVLETSPYLLQHAHNPVDWYPWGDEAFEMARKLKRPVLMSVGYSTCHWCHVMEEESFEDLEIARYLNEHYIAIKVDREERPDIDAIYMQAVRMITRGGGGWPMTVWLTPDRKPFYGGTYFPPRTGVRGSRRGFLELLKEIKEAYEANPEAVAHDARLFAERVQKDMGSSTTGTLKEKQALHAAVATYTQRYDSTWGGLQAGRRGTKFPSSFPVRLLFRYARRTGRKDLVDMAAFTLEKMAAGGMYDQVGGGFHRYSTDPRWLVPHFEKMLYDNALLVPAYTEAFQVTKDAKFARTAREILAYVNRDMISPQGAFYSATDADSLSPDGHREEGLYFVWTPTELDQVLGEPLSRVVKTVYAVTPGGNFEGRSILWLPKSRAEVAQELGMSVEALDVEIAKARELLYKARQSRSLPLRDDKILTAWNGLMISAYAQAALVFPEDRLGARSYTEIAVRAAEFVLENLRRDGRLLRTYTDGKARLKGYLSDYAFVIAGLLDVFEATGQARWLDHAVHLDNVLSKYYEDTYQGGFFRTASDHEALLARDKPYADDAVPSGNSVQVMNLLRLGEFTTDANYRARAEKALSAFAVRLNQAPTSMDVMLLAVDYYTDTVKEVVIVTPSNRAEAQPFLDALATGFVPNRALAVVPAGSAVDALSKRVPWVAAKIAQRGQATAYVCENQRCELPTRDPSVFLKQVTKARSL